MCAVCDNGFCPRHHIGMRDWLDFWPWMVDVSESRQEQETEEIGLPFWEQPAL